MEAIQKMYLEKCKTKSDIYKHLPTLLRYGLRCRHITEMGVRKVASTWPLLLSKPQRMVSYDILKDPNVDEVIQIAAEYNIDYSFIEADVLTVKIEQTDLLFIDTLHTYGQLTAELVKHATNVSKYIVLHDTVSFGYKDEAIYGHASSLVKDKSSTKQGLVAAIDDFLLSEIGKKWYEYEVYSNNNGLTVLEKRE